MRKNFILLIYILIFSVLLSACNAADTQPTAKPMPSRTASRVPTQTEMSTETPVPTPVPTPIPLSAKGPWLVFTADALGNAKVFGVNANGTGKTLLLEGYVLYQVAGAPTNDLLATIVYGQEELSYKLLLIKLSEGEIVHEVSLLSYYEDQSENFDDGPTGPLGGIHSDI